MSNKLTTRLPRLSQDKTLLVGAILFVSSVLGGVGLAACDSNAGAEPTPGGTAPPGQAVFARYCNVCHPGGGRGSGPSLRAIPLTGDQIRTYVRQGKERMPAFGPNLISDAQLTQLVEYIQALK